MLLSKTCCMGPIAPVFIGRNIVKWVTKTKLLGMTVDDKITRVPHTSEIRKTFAKKLNLLKLSRYLPRKVLEEFYFKVILPSVEYSLVLWGACSNADLMTSMERLHCRRSLDYFQPSQRFTICNGIGHAKWTTLHFCYKLETFKVIHKAYNGRLPEILQENIIQKRSQRYSFMKDSIHYRGAVLQNTVTYGHNLPTYQPTYQLTNLPT